MPLGILPDNMMNIQRMGIAAAKQCPSMCISLIVVTRRRRSAGPRVQGHDGAVVRPARSAAHGPDGPARGAVRVSLKKPGPLMLRPSTAPPDRDAPHTPRQSPGPAHPAALGRGICCSRRAALPRASPPPRQPRAPPHTMLLPLARQHESRIGLRRPRSLSLLMPPNGLEPRA